MTKITRDDVQHLAQLSSLLLDEAEIDSLQKDIEGILESIKQLEELDTEGVEPTYQVTDRENVFRDDVVVNYGVNREALIDLAAEQENGSVKVPKVLSW